MINDDDWIKRLIERTYAEPNKGGVWNQWDRNAGRLVGCYIYLERVGDMHHFGHHGSEKVLLALTDEQFRCQMVPT